MNDCVSLILENFVILQRIPYKPAYLQAWQPFKSLVSVGSPILEVTHESSHGGCDFL